MKLTKAKLKQIIKEELKNLKEATLSKGLDPSKAHVFKKLKSGKWGKVSWPEEKELPKGYIKIPANKKGFPYDDHGERQETLNKM